MKIILKTCGGYLVRYCSRCRTSVFLAGRHICCLWWRHHRTRTMEPPDRGTRTRDTRDSRWTQPTSCLQHWNIWRIFH